MKRGSRCLMEPSAPTTCTFDTHVLALRVQHTSICSLLSTTSTTTVVLWFCSSVLLLRSHEDHNNRRPHEAASHEKEKIPRRSRNKKRRLQNSAVLHNLLMGSPPAASHTWTILTGLFSLHFNTSRLDSKLLYFNTGPPLTAVYTGKKTG